MTYIDIVVTLAYIGAAVYYRSAFAFIALSAVCLSGSYLYSPYFDINQSWRNHFIVGLIYCLSVIPCIKLKIFRQSISLMMFAAFQVIALLVDIEYPKTDTLFDKNYELLAVAVNLYILFTIHKGGRSERRRNNKRYFVGDFFDRLYRNLVHKSKERSKGA